MTEQKEKAYNIQIVRVTEVEVFAESAVEAGVYVKDMYENGDSVADLGDPTYRCIGVRDLDERGRPVGEFQLDDVGPRGVPGSYETFAKEFSALIKRHNAKLGADTHGTMVLFENDEGEYYL